MRMHNKPILALAGTAMAAATVLTGVTAASASPGSPRPGVSGTEHFQIVNGSPTSSKASFIGTGVFTAGGIDLTGQRSDTIKVAGGTFKINHSQGHGKQSFNPRTCMFRLSLGGKYTVTGGTGKFAGISGHGTYLLTVLAIGPKVRGKCSMTKAPLAQQQEIQASGPVRL